MSSCLRLVQSISKSRSLLKVPSSFNLSGTSCKSSTLASRYRNLLKTRPILVQAVQAGLLMGTGDLIAQAYIEKTPLPEVNYVRSCKFFALGLIFVVSIFDLLSIFRCSYLCFFNIRVRLFVDGTDC